MFSYVCFARLQASMTWDVLDMSRVFWIAGVKGLVQVRADLLITPLCKHSYSNTFCSHCTPFGQQWKLAFNSTAALQWLVLTLCKYIDGTTEREMVPISWISQRTQSRAQHCSDTQAWACCWHHQYGRQKWLWEYQSGQKEVRFNHGLSSVPLLGMASLDWVTAELFLDRNGWLEGNQWENVCNRTKQEGY